MRGKRKVCGAGLLRFIHHISKRRENGVEAIALWNSMRVSKEKICSKAFGIS